MSKSRSDEVPTPEARPTGPPPLNAGVRRHLGQTLRTIYADILSAPPGARIEALMTRLGEAKR